MLDILEYLSVRSQKNREISRLLSSGIRKVKISIKTRTDHRRKKNCVFLKQSRQNGGSRARSKFIISLVIVALTNIFQYLPQSNNKQQLKTLNLKVYSVLDIHAQGYCDIIES